MNKRIIDERVAGFDRGSVDAGDFEQVVLMTGDKGRLLFEREQRSSGSISCEWRSGKSL